MVFNMPMALNTSAHSVYYFSTQVLTGIATGKSWLRLAETTMMYSFAMGLEPARRQEQRVSSVWLLWDSQIEEILRTKPRKQKMDIPSSYQMSIHIYKKKESGGNQSAPNPGRGVSYAGQNASVCLPHPVYCAISQEPMQKKYLRAKKRGRRRTKGKWGTPNKSLRIHGAE